MALGCASKTKTPQGPVGIKPGEPPPDWLSEPPVESDRICSWGMAGRAHNLKSEAPKELAKERAIENLAGVFHTTVTEAQIVRGTERTDIIEDVEISVEVPEDIVQKTQQDSKTSYWRDDAAKGPLGREAHGFTYARSCVDVSTDKLDKKRIAALQTPPFADDPPEWVRWIGSRAGARLCAVGYSEPFYDPAAIFQAVVKDVRAQLKTNATTMIMDNFSEITTCRNGQCNQFIDDVIKAATDAISEGVVVTHFWYDQHGRGANRRKRTAYGWGCVYPVHVMAIAAKALVEKHPEIKPADVKQAADKMFDDLEAMEEKHEAKLKAVTPAPQPELEDPKEPKDLKEDEPEEPLEEPAEKFEEIEPPSTSTVAKTD